MSYSPSVGEAALIALKAVLSGLGATVLRNIPVDVTMAVPTGGLIILRDGDPGEPEMTLGPVTYQYDHMAEVEIFVRGARSGLDARFDALRQAVGSAILADRRLGGAVMWANPAAAVALDLPSSSEVPIKAASIPVQLVYVTSNPLI